MTPDGIISTVAGNGQQGYSGDGGPATSASLNKPAGITVDGQGNLYIAGDSRIRKMTPDGIISTVAGNGQCGYSRDEGPTTFVIISPCYITVDKEGNLYIADSDDHRIRKMTPDGIISTVAGNGQKNYSGDGSPATSVNLSSLSGVTVDRQGNLYIADQGNHRIRKVTPNGIITTVAGNGQRGYSGDGGAAILATLFEPQHPTVDKQGNLYIADYVNNRIRKVTPDGIISTVAGNGQSGYSGDGGPATSANMSFPCCITADEQGNLYIADDNRVRKVTPDGIISTVVGNGEEGYSGDGGPATSASLGYPSGITADKQGNLYIADGSRIRKVTYSSETYQLSHSPESIGEGDSVTFTLKTTNVAKGTEFAFTIGGTVERFDYQTNPPSSFIVGDNGIATATFNITADQKEEGNETLTLSLDNRQASDSVSIYDRTRLVVNFPTGLKMTLGKKLSELNGLANLLGSANVDGWFEFANPKKSLRKLVVIECGFSRKHQGRY